MAGDEPWTPKPLVEFPLHRPSSDEKQRAFRQEEIIRELISMGEPLPVVLNDLCASIDLEIDNVVSVITLAPAGDSRQVRQDVQDHGTETRVDDPQTVASSPQEFGLHILRTAAIALPGCDRLGSLEVYCDASRVPTELESRLFDRVAHLAALAIQHHHDQKDFDSFFTHWKHPPPKDPGDPSQAT